MLIDLSLLFRSGADKVSIGSDAVYIAEEYLRTNFKSGESSIELISEVYGAQAVVVSIDPKRVYVDDIEKCPHACVHTSKTGGLFSQSRLYELTRGYYKLF